MMTPEVAARVRALAGGYARSTLAHGHIAIPAGVTPKPSQKPVQWCVEEQITICPAGSLLAMQRGTLIDTAWLAKEVTDAGGKVRVVAVADDTNYSSAQAAALAKHLGRLADKLSSA